MLNKFTSVVYFGQGGCMCVYFGQGGDVLRWWILTSSNAIIVLNCLHACSMDILWRSLEGDNRFGQFNRRTEIDVDFLFFVTDLLVIWVWIETQRSLAECLFPILLSSIDLFCYPYLSMEGGIWGSVQLVEGHPALRQQILVLSMRAAEELLVRQHSGSVPWVAKKGAKKTPGKMKDNLSIWHSIWFLKWNFDIIIYICLCPCTKVIQACSGVQNLGCWSHTVVSMRQLWFAKFFYYL